MGEQRNTGGFGMKQGELFDHMLDAYADANASMSNEELYRDIGCRAGLPPAAWDERLALGPGQGGHSALKRKVRWWQQSLRRLGLVERDAAKGRGYWQITPKGRRKLTPAPGGRVLVGFSTHLGVALWGAAGDVFPALNEPIGLALTSPPYPLARPRAYGNPSAAEIVDWVCNLLEPIVKNLVPGGSVLLNVSNDIFERKSPARSLYRERLVIALCERLGLHKMDEFVWHDPTKAPGPLHWASITRQQFNVAWEPVYWFSNAPALVRADNRRVLEPHLEKHLALIHRGGERRVATNGDGAYRIRHGSFGAETAGRIQRNVLSFPHRCGDKEQARRMALEQGLPAHAATMPLRLAKMLIEFLTEPDDLVVDPCGGWFTTGKAAEGLGRRWVSVELMGEYVLGGANRFRAAPGFEVLGGLSLSGA